MDGLIEALENSVPKLNWLEVLDQLIEAMIMEKTNDSSTDEKR